MTSTLTTTSKQNNIAHFSEDPATANKVQAGLEMAERWDPSHTRLEDALEASRVHWQDGDSAMPRAFVDSLNRSLGELVQHGLDRTAAAVGSAFPVFAMPNSNGQLVSSESLLAEGPLVVMFYRGGWCPYCNLALRAMQFKLDAIESAGASLVAVSPEPPDDSLSTSEKNELRFNVLTDAGSILAENAGIVWEMSDEAVQWQEKFFGLQLENVNGHGQRNRLPVPATFVLDTSGIVRWRFVEAAYWRRADPDAVVEAVRSL